MSVPRRILQVILFVITLTVAVAAGAVIVTQTVWFRDWLRGVVERQAGEYLNGTLTIGRLHGNLFSGIGLDDVEITMEGQPVVGVRQIVLAYDAVTLIGGDIVLDELRLDGPVIRAERTADGWNLERLLNLPTPDPDAPPRERPIEIREFTVTDGTVHVEGEIGGDAIDVPRRVDRLDLSLSLASGADELVVDIARLSAQAHDPALHLADFSGTIRRTEQAVALEGLHVRTAASGLDVAGEVRGIETSAPELDLHIASDGLALQEIGAIVTPLAEYPLTPAFSITTRGPLDRLVVDAQATEPQIGEVTAALTADAVGPARQVAGAADVVSLDLAPALRNPRLESDITGRVRFDLTLPTEAEPLRGTYAVSAPRLAVAGYQVSDLSADGRVDGDRIEFDGVATAYGARATAAGTVVAGTPLQLDVRGRAAGLDLRQLPPALDVPPVASRLTLDYRVSGRGSVFAGDVSLQRSLLAGATIEPGTTAEFRVGDGAPAFAARGAVTNLDLQQIGAAFDIGALAADRFRSAVHGTFDVTGQGGGQRPLTLDATASLANSDLLGAHLPAVDLVARLEADDLHLQVDGTFERLDPSALTGDERHAGALAGTADVNATIRGYHDGVAIDDVDADGRVTLGPSTAARLAIESASLDAAFVRGVGEVRELTITGRDLTAKGEGTVALIDEASSNFTVHLETPSLDEIGELVGQPLQGALILDAVVTGNARELTVEGQMQGSQFAYRNIEALTLASDFHVTLPELTPADATIQATSRATFLEIAGQAVTELEAEVTFREPQLEFVVEAQEGVRQLTAAGSAVFHPDRQEIRLTDLGLQAEEVAWRIVEGTQALIDYGGDRVAIDALQLSSVGDQHIEIEGVFGEPGKALQVSVRNVDVAELDRLVLGDNRIGGRLTADAMISGTMDEPRVGAGFTLAPGAFADFMFESLTGTVDYAGSGVEIDVRLDQAPEHWLTATGYAPVSLFRPTPPDADRGAAQGPGERVDLTLESSAIDLGVIQGFTAAVTDVAGTLQANVRVTGTGFDPYVEGAVDIRDGALTVPALGTSYTGIATRLELDDDIVTIQEMRILDGDENPLTVGGTLAVQERGLGTFDVQAAGRGFQVMDNEMGDVAVDVDLRLSGDVRAPRVRGVIEIAEGTIEVAELVQQVTTSPYRTDTPPIDPLAPPPPPPDAPVGGPLDQEDAAPADGEDAVLAGDDAAGAKDDAAGAKDGEAAQAEEDTAAEPSFFDAVDLEIGVAVPSNLLLRGTGIRPAGAPVAVGDMNVTVGGALQIRKAPGDALRLNGEVNTIRGHYTFQGRRFDILRDGRIRFVGDEVIDPLLDIRARREISSVETVIHVQGTMRQPELAFSSSPPLDQADILSLIVFNQPLNELGEGQQISLAERAGALAGGYLAAGLTRSIGRVIGLDEFEIQARGELGTTPRVIIGERIGDDLFVRIEHGFGAGEATEFALEYQIAEFLRLTGSVAETPGGAERVQFRRVERGGIDLTFFFTF